MALAYRQMCLDQLEELKLLVDVIGRIDERVAGWIDDPEFQRIYTNIKDGKVGGETVHDMDRRFYEWGEDWHAGFEPHYEDDEWVDSVAAGAILSLGSKHVITMVNQGQITAAQLMKLPGDHVKRWYFRVGDMRALAAERAANPPVIGRRLKPRSHKRASADTIAANGDGVAE
jgi:hypothetical protein